MANVLVSGVSVEMYCDAVSTEAVPKQEPLPKLYVDKVAPLSADDYLLYEV